MPRLPEFFARRPAAAARRPARRRLLLDQLEARQLLAGIPLGAAPDDTGEFMLGKVVVTPVLMESNGQIDVNRENWTTLLIQQAKDKIVEGLQWWEDTLAAITPVHSLDFVYDFTYADNPVATPYEPIARISNDYSLWIEDFFSTAGLDSSSGVSSTIRAFNHAQRTAFDADWAFTIFVVNDDNDVDGSFALGGSFSRAFAFAGGRFFVSPAGRPASTFAHEAGHIFWARDEYLGGGSHSDFRGYYNTQNLNAADNPAPGFQQVDSIMASGALLDNAYANHTSSPTSLEMIGWRDSDNDGVFDVLDVPLSLTATGSHDPVAGLYHIAGQSAAQTLPNLNPSGLQNDITINEVNLLEYRIDGGVWLTAESYDAYVVNFDVAVSVGDFDQIEFRTRSVDPGTGLTVTTSEIFVGAAAEPAGWQNRPERHDVDNDGFVAPNDVLIIINDLNLNGGRALPNPPPGGNPTFYLDVNGDGFVAPDDALAVINFLNVAPAPPPAESEGESPNKAPAGEGELALAAFLALPSHQSQRIDWPVAAERADSEIRQLQANSPSLAPMVIDWQGDLLQQAVAGRLNSPEQADGYLSRRISAANQSRDEFASAAARRSTEKSPEEMRPENSVRRGLRNWLAEGPGLEGLLDQIAADVANQWTGTGDAENLVDPAEVNSG